MSNSDTLTLKGRKKKSGTLVSAYIETDAYDLLSEHCDRTGQSKTMAIERAIRSYCKDPSSK